MLRRIYLAGCLVITCILFASAQIDTKDITLTSDSTFTTRPDTAFWRFDTADATFTRPNGTTRVVPVFEGKLIVWKGGKRTVPITSGILFKREYMDFLRQYLDQHNNEIGIITTALSGVRDRRDALVTEIQNARDR